MTREEYIHTQLKRWWDQNHRELPWRETHDPYRIWISEVILQQTRVNQGLDYYLRFVQQFPTVRDLAEAQEKQVMRLWQGLGYYSRARNLHRAAKMIMSNGGVFPRTFTEIRQLPGIGDYTAGAILSFAYNEAYPALDGNVYRVIARLYDIDMAFDTTQGKKYFRGIAEQLLDREDARRFNSAIMEFGALYCTPTLNNHAIESEHTCAECVLSSVCVAYQNGTADLLPIRKARLQPTIRRMDYYIYLTPSHHTYIHQRMEKDIWQHLWEFPLVEPNESDTLPPQEKGAKLIWKGTHQLSHRKIEAKFYVIPTPEETTIHDTIKVSWTELDNYAFSRLTLRALEVLTATF